LQDELSNAMKNLRTSGSGVKQPSINKRKGKKQSTPSPSKTSSGVGSGTNYKPSDSAHLANGGVDETVGWRFDPETGTEHTYKT
jgi:hypothetical protein